MNNNTLCPFFSSFHRAKLPCSIARVILVPLIVDAYRRIDLDVLLIDVIIYMVYQRQQNYFYFIKFFFNQIHVCAC